MKIFYHKQGIIGVYLILLHANKISLQNPKQLSQYIVSSYQQKIIFIKARIKISFFNACVFIIWRGVTLIK